MRYIHNGELKNRTIDPPSTFVFDEPVSMGSGKTPTFADALHKLRKTDSNPLIIGHEPSSWRWTR